MSRRPADQLMHTLQRALVPRARPNPLVVGWRWRYELTATAAVTLLAVTIHRTGAAGAVAIAAALVVATATFARWQGAWRRLLARAWCVVTPHRLRVAFVQARIHSLAGRLPAVLSCSPRPYGESVLLWLPAGVTPGDLHAGRPVMAVACYASDVRIVLDGDRPHLVTLQVMRRDG